MSNIEKSTEIKEKKGSDVRIRTIASIAILLFLLPLMIVGSVPQISTLGYQYFYAIVLIIMTSYGIYEITNAVLPFNKSNNKHLLVFIYASLFSLTMMINLIGSIVFEEILVLTWYASILIPSILFLFLSIFSNVEFREYITILVISILLSLFIESIWLTSKLLAWNILFWPIIIAIAADTFAYFGGKAIGKTHPFPNISPNKTTAGMVIGISSGAVIGLIWYFGTIYPDNIANITYLKNNAIKQIPIWAGILFSIIPAFFGPMGDLFYSKIKRNIGIKDFSNLIPGHGGLLDRIDSHTFATTITSILLFSIFII